MAEWWAEQWCRMPEEYARRAAPAMYRPVLAALPCCSIQGSAARGSLSPRSHPDAGVIRGLRGQAHVGAPGQVPPHQQAGAHGQLGGQGDGRGAKGRRRQRARREVVAAPARGHSGRGSVGARCRRRARPRRPLQSTRPQPPSPQRRGGAPLGVGAVGEHVGHAPWEESAQRIAALLPGEGGADRHHRRRRGVARGVGSAGLAEGVAVGSAACGGWQGGWRGGARWQVGPGRRRKHACMHRAAPRARNAGAAVASTVSRRRRCRRGAPTWAALAAGLAELPAQLGLGQRGPQAGGALQAGGEERPRICQGPCKAAAGEHPASQVVAARKRSCCSRCCSRLLLQGGPAQQGARQASTWASTGRGGTARGAKVGFTPSQTSTNWNRASWVYLANSCGGQETKEAC